MKIVKGWVEISALSWISFLINISEKKGIMSGGLNNSRNGEAKRSDCKLLFFPPTDVVISIDLKNGTEWAHTLQKR